MRRAASPLGRVLVAVVVASIEAVAIFVVVFVAFFANHIAGVVVVATVVPCTSIATSSGGVVLFVAAQEVVPIHKVGGRWRELLAPLWARPVGWGRIKVLHGLALAPTARRGGG